MIQNGLLEVFGFRSNKASIHTARTMMFTELKSLLEYVNDVNAKFEHYKKAVCEDNCLAKRSEKSRELTFRHLVDLYSLDSKNLLFRNLLFFWTRDVQAQPLLALLCAISRDTILNSSIPLVLGLSLGAVLSREIMEDFIDNSNPGRFSPATLKSVAQNINSSWTQSGHLTGRANKTRTQAFPTPGSVSYALLLAYLNGERGENLFRSEFITLLDCSFEMAIGLAEIASQKGWITFKQVSNVYEVLFPNLLTTEEMEFIHG